MKTLLALIQLIPALIELIKKVETEFPGAGKGKMKLDVIKDLLTAGYSGITAMWPALVVIIGVLVNAFNKDEDNTLFVKDE